MDANIDALQNNHVLSQLQYIDPDDNFFNYVYRRLSQLEISLYYNINNYNKTFSDGPATYNLMNFKVRSFNKNGDMYSALLQSLYRPPDIVVLTETWLDVDDESISSLEGYEAMHSIREHGRSGGVSVYRRIRLSVTPIVDLTICNELIESCVAEIDTGLGVFVLFGIYRPHSGNID